MLLLGCRTQSPSVRRLNVHPASILQKDSFCLSRFYTSAFLKSSFAICAQGIPFCARADCLGLPSHLLRRHLCRTSQRICVNTPICFSSTFSVALLKASPDSTSVDSCLHKGSVCPRRLPTSALVTTLDFLRILFAICAQQCRGSLSMH